MSLVDTMIKLTVAKTGESSSFDAGRIEGVQPVAGGTMIVMKSGWNVCVSESYEYVMQSRADLLKLRWDAVN